MVVAVYYRRYDIVLKAVWLLQNELLKKGMIKICLEWMAITLGSSITRAYCSCGLAYSDLDFSVHLQDFR